MKIEAMKIEQWESDECRSSKGRFIVESDYRAIMRVIRAAEKYSSNHTNEGLYDLQDALSALRGEKKASKS